MRKQLAIGLASLASLASLAAAVAVTHTASAASPQSASVVVATTFDDQPDDITSATGALSTACAGGTTTDGLFHAGPSPDKWPTHSGAAQLRVGKFFHCAGGDFTADLTVTLDLADGTTSGTWVVTSGTGDFQHMRGHGTVQGTPFEGGIEDSYSGVVTGL